MGTAKGSKQPRGLRVPSEKRGIQLSLENRRKVKTVALEETDKGPVSAPSTPWLCGFRGEVTDRDTCETWQRGTGCGQDVRQGPAPGSRAGQVFAVREGCR